MKKLFIYLNCVLGLVVLSDSAFGSRLSYKEFDSLRKSISKVTGYEVECMFRRRSKCEGVVSKLANASKELQKLNAKIKVGSGKELQFVPGYVSYNFTNSSKDIKRGIEIIPPVVWIGKNARLSIRKIRRGIHPGINQLIAQIEKNKQDNQEVIGLLEEVINDLRSQYITYGKDIISGNYIRFIHEFLAKNTLTVKEVSFFEHNPRSLVGNYYFDCTFNSNYEPCNIVRISMKNSSKSVHVKLSMDQLEMNPKGEANRVIEEIHNKIAEEKATEDLREKTKSKLSHIQASFQTIDLEVGPSSLIQESKSVEKLEEDNMVTLRSLVKGLESSDKKISVKVNDYHSLRKNAKVYLKFEESEIGTTVLSKPVIEVAIHVNDLSDKALLEKLNEQILDLNNLISKNKSVINALSSQRDDYKNWREVTLEGCRTSKNSDLDFRKCKASVLFFAHVASTLKQSFNHKYDSFGFSTWNLAISPREGSEPLKYALGYSALGFDDEVSISFGTDLLSADLDNLKQEVEAVVHPLLFATNKGFWLYGKYKEYNGEIDSRLSDKLKFIKEVLMSGPLGFSRIVARPDKLSVGLRPGGTFYENGILYVDVNQSNYVEIVHEILKDLKSN